mmetsp:Transcript_37342/g.52720  ORF Transcript_37342/g.52720 Transcript_37342/m.52720 type:complete len:199 (-) Transcript_37342:34-630(-)
MAEPATPWYDKELKYIPSVEPPADFKIATACDDIERNMFLDAISNRFVPPAAVMCYAKFVCDSIRCAKKPGFLMPAPQLKKIGGALIDLLYGENPNIKTKNFFQKRYTERKIGSKARDPRKIHSAVFEANPEQDQLTNISYPQTTEKGSCYDERQKLRRHTYNLKRIGGILGSTYPLSVYKAKKGERSRRTKGNSKEK